MKIVMTIPDLKLKSGGPSISVALLARSIAEQGINLCLCATDNGEQTVIENNLPFEVKMVSAEKGTFNALKRFGKEIDDMLAGKSNVIVHDHAVWTLFNNEAVKTSLKRKVPYVISPHGMLETWALANKWAKKRLAWKLYQQGNLKRANVLHATAYQEAVNLRNIGLQNPIAIIPNIGEQPPLLAREPRDRGGKKTLLFLSRIHPKKGLPNLIEAWNKVRPSDWQLIIAGPDQDGHQDIIKALVDRYNLSNEVNFTGPVYKEEKWRLYEQADLFVLPSYSENFGMVVTEALAMGVPVITTKAAPWQELETDGCGWWIDTGVEPLVEVLGKAFATTDEERHEMGLRGKKLVAEKYSSEAVATKMISVYEWVLGGGSPPACVLTD